MADVEFYFDFSCPWTWLAFGRLREATMRTASSVVWCPFELEALQVRLGREPGARFSADARVRRWEQADLAAWARYCDVPLQIPAGWPHDLGRLLRGAALAADAGRAPAYCAAVFDRYFGAGSVPLEDGDIESLGVAAGFEPGRLVAEIDAPRWREALEANTAALAERGGFASATMFVGEQMYVGNERMPLVEFALAQASDRTFVMPGQHG